MAGVGAVAGEAPGVDAALLASNFRILIIDEADELLSAGFKDQVYNIFQ